MKNIIKESQKKWITIFFAILGAVVGVIIALTGSKLLDWKQDSKIVNESAEHIVLIKDYLKEPTSLRLYEGSYKVEIPKLKTTIYLIKFDSKNGFGAYGGQRCAEILDLEYAPTTVLTDYDQRYLGLIDGVEGRTSISLEEINVTKIDTKKLAKKLKCDYIN